MTDLSKWKCHKEVHATKIAAIEFEADGSAKVAPADVMWPTYSTKPGFRARFRGDEGDLGYLVVYEDGYESWSPSKAFEEGYTRI